MLFLLICGVVVGLSLAVWASRSALDAATQLGVDLGLSPFVIGITIVAVGTDLPEVANSIVASAQGHGDLNVGDSIGSVVTQATAVLGLTCLSAELTSERRSVITAGSLTVLALVVGAALLDDRHFGRLDGAALLALWIVGTIVMQRPGQHPQTTSEAGGPIAKNVVRTLGWLLVVGVGATLAVETFIRAADSLGAPEFLTSFFVMSLGTSLPELVIATQAVRQNDSGLALGDLLGSSFVDASLSPGIGPLLFPTTLTVAVSRTHLIVAVVLALVTTILARDDRHRWATGLSLIFLYLMLFPTLLP